MKKRVSEKYPECACHRYTNERIHVGKTGSKVKSQFLDTIDYKLY